MPSIGSAHTDGTNLGDFSRDSMFPSEGIGAVAGAGADLVVVDSHRLIGGATAPLLGRIERSNDINLLYSKSMPISHSSDRSTHGNV